MVYSGFKRGVCPQTVCMLQTPDRLGHVFPVKRLTYTGPRIVHHAHAGTFRLNDPMFWFHVDVLWAGFTRSALSDGQTSEVCHPTAWFEQQGLCTRCGRAMPVSSPPACTVSMTAEILLSSFIDTGCHLGVCMSCQMLMHTDHSAHQDARNVYQYMHPNSTSVVLVCVVHELCAPYNCRCVTCAPHPTRWGPPCRHPLLLEQLPSSGSTLWMASTHQVMSNMDNICTCLA